MRILWAPWRMTYIKEVSRQKSRCIFCEAVRGGGDYVVTESKHSVALLNIYPYNTAHVMVAPKRHVPDLELLNERELADLMNLVKKVISAIRSEYNPEGFNIGINIGRVAGAGIEEHLHIHIVPRWCGDTNFMPVIAQTKVMPEDLQTTLARLRKYFR